VVVGGEVVDGAAVVWGGEVVGAWVLVGMDVVGGKVVGGLDEGADVVLAGWVSTGVELSASCPPMHPHVIMITIRKMTDIFLMSYFSRIR